MAFLLKISMLACILLSRPSHSQLLPGLLNTVESITGAASSVNSAESLLEYFGSIPLGQKPFTVKEAVEDVVLALNQSGGNPVSLGGLLRLSGLGSLLDPVGEQLSGCGFPCTDHNLGNPDVTPSIYKTIAGDAPWDVPENKLRAALYLPPGFTNGRKIPVIMVPGTGMFGSSSEIVHAWLTISDLGNYGKQSFSANFGKKFSASNVADPVYLNVPEYLLDDAQVNGEYVAYAIKYISALTRRKVGVLTWSQGMYSISNRSSVADSVLGSLDTAWGLQYWPSARQNVSDVINLSGDYKGTPFLDVLCVLPVCEYSLWQQQPNSKFIATLREGGGSSAYVPTTSIMSLTDDVVPQLGGPSASGYIEDERHVGVSNTFIQEVCSLQLGGIPYTHEGVMFSNLAYDMAIDALTHDGPGEVSRLNLKQTCSYIAIDGLDVTDIIHTELATPQAFYNIFTQPATNGEPPIKAYASK
jgi:hypothetical protein